MGLFGFVIELLLRVLKTNFEVVQLIHETAKEEEEKADEKDSTPSSQAPTFAQAPLVVPKIDQFIAKSPPSQWEMTEQDQVELMEGTSRFGVWDVLGNAILDELVVLLPNSEPELKSKLSTVTLKTLLNVIATSLSTHHPADFGFLRPSSAKVTDPYVAYIGYQALSKGAMDMTKFWWIQTAPRILKWYWEALLEARQ